MPFFIIAILITGRRGRGRWLIFAIKINHLPHLNPNPSSLLSSILRTALPNDINHRTQENHSSSFVLMKKSGFFAASLAAASATATALSTSSPAPAPAPAFLWDSGLTPRCSHQEGGDAENSSTRASLTEKFAPRFDGLRFIETLVTAHR